MNPDATSAPSSPSQVHPDSSIAVTIDTPANNSNVPGGGTFTTYGFCSPNAGVTKSAKVTDGTNQWNGETAPVIGHMPPYQWAFKFTGLPLNVQLQLTVSAHDNMGDMGSDTITITCVS